MAQVIVLLIGLILAFKIFENRNNSFALVWILVGLTLLNGYIKIIQFPISLSVLRWFIYIALFILLIYANKTKFVFSRFPLKGTMWILVICVFLIALPDSRLSIYQKIYKPFREITETFFILFIAYFFSGSSKDIVKYFGKPIVYLSIIIGVAGLLNFLFKSNFYYEWVISNFFHGGDADLESKARVLEEHAGRFRASSTFDYTFNYGFVSSIFTIFIMYLSTQDIFRFSKTSILMKLAFASAILGVFLSFSRSVFFVFVVGFIVYVFFSYSNYKKFKYLIISMSLLLFTYLTSPVLRESIDNSVDLIITGGSRVSGSSLEMRGAQFFGASTYFLQNPIFGNGYYYINDELGWGDRDSGVADKEMFGFESLLFVLMIEQGVLGLFSKFLFFFLLLVYFYKNLSINRKTAGFGLSVCVMFMIFAFSNGVLGSWPFAMLFAGISMKSLELEKVGL